LVEEEWKDGKMERWNVEALAEIPHQRERNGRIESWEFSRKPALLGMKIRKESHHKKLQ